MIKGREDPFKIFNFWAKIRARNLSKIVKILVTNYLDVEMPHISVHTDCEWFLSLPNTPGVGTLLDGRNGGAKIKLST